MTLKTFTIKKLFNKYDITIKCDEKCAILLGANGVGKSTALIIFYYFLRGNYVDIVAAPFDSIFMTFDHDEVYEIKYEEFLPTKEFIIKCFNENLRRKIFDMPYEDDYDRIMVGQPKSVEKLTSEFEKAIDEICEYNRYGEFVYNLYSGREFSNIVKKILQKYTDYNDLIKSNIVMTDEYANIRFFPSALVTRATTQGERILEIDEKVYMFDSVRNYKISNNMMFESFLSDADLEWIHSKPDVARHHKDLIKEVFLKKYDRYKTYEEFSISQHFDYGESIPNAKYRVFNELQKNNVFEINRLINFEYYDFSFVIAINGRAFKYIEQFFDHYGSVYLYGAKWAFGGFKDEENYTDYEQEASKEVQNLLTDDALRDYYEYVKPILFKNSFFDMDLVSGDIHSEYERIDSNYVTNVQSIVKRKLLLDYMNEVVPLLKNNQNRTEKINNFEEVLKKYLVDKHIEIKPCGIQIKEGTAISHTPQSLFVLYDSNDIDLSVISSGEKKILIILAVAIFGDAVLFLDEPELSLSLVWQESLLPDILKYGNTKGLFLATHSPYISRAEELEQYLTFLPQRNN